MGVKYSNNAKTTLSASVNTSATSVSVASSSGFPSLSGGDYFYATMVQQSDDTALEIVKVTAVSGTTWTISRAQDNTSAGSFASGDKIELRASAGVFIDLFAEKAPAANPTFTGNITIGSAEISETELEILDGATVTTAELNKLDGTTATAASLTYGKDLYDTDVTAAEFDYLDGVTSNIQTQITAKMSQPSGFARGSVIIGNSSGNPANLGIGANGYVLKSDGTDIAWAEDEKTTTTNFVKNAFTGDNSTSAFTLSQSPNSEDNLIVFIEGVFQNQGDYTLSGTTLTFDTAPATGRKIVAYHVKAAVSGANLNHDQFTASGSAAFTLSITPINENNTQVFIDGVYQQKTDYAVSGTTLTFDTAPASGAIVEVMTFTQTEINVPTTGSVVTASIANDVNLNGNPTTTTQSAGNNTTRIATTAFVETTVSNLIDSAPGTMNTLNEIAAALGDDPTFTTTVNNAIATKLPLAGGTMTGNLVVNAIVDADNFKINNSQGSDGQVLTSTGSGVAWETPSSFNADAAQTFNDSGAAVDFRIEGDTEQNLFFVDGSADKIGIGTASPDYRFVIKGAAATNDNVFKIEDSAGVKMASMEQDSSGNGRWIVCDTSGNADVLIHTAGNSYFNGGNVGIGTNAPMTLLHVFEGDGSYPDDANNHFVVESDSHSYIGIGGGTTSDCGIHFGDSGAIDRGRVAYSNNNDAMSFNTAATERATINSTGGVTMKSSHQGDTIGNLLVTSQVPNSPNASENCQISVKNGGQMIQIMAWAGLGARVGTRTSGWSSNSGGNCYLTGQDSTCLVLKSDGVAYLANGSTAVTSDERLKKNITDMADGQLEKINALKVRHFEWKDGRKAGTQTGVIAQEAEIVEAALVTETEIAPDPDDTSRDFTGDVKIVKYGDINMRLLKAVQELSAKLDAAEARIATLEG